AEVHRPAGRVEAQADLGGGGDLRGQRVAAVAGGDEVVVGGGGAAGAGQPGQRAGGGHPHRVLVDARPDRVEGAQPLEQGVVGGQTAGDPLVRSEEHT